MTTGHKLLRLYAWVSLIIAAAKLIAGYYAVTIASGHIKQRLLDMAAFTWLEAAILFVGVVCLLYTLHADGWLVWAKDTFHAPWHPLSQSMDNIASVLRERMPPQTPATALKLSHDVDARSALLYAANRTWVPRDYKQPVDSDTAPELQRLFDALDRFYESASHEGGIRVWGRTSTSRPPKLVERTHWQDWYIDYPTIFADPATAEPLRTVPRNRLPDDSSPYYDLRLNKAEVEGVWPANDHTALRLRLAQLRTAGSAIRNKGQALTADLPGWIAESHAWMRETVAAIKAVDAPDAEWFETLDTVEPARVPFAPINPEQAAEHEQAFYMHDQWLAKLEQLYIKHSTRN